MTEVWWVINEDILLSALERVSRGEDPHIMFLELVANSRVDEE
jgi:hypothetical protein